MENALIPTQRDPQETRDLFGPVMEVDPDHIIGARFQTRPLIPDLVEKLCSDIRTNGQHSPALLQRDTENEERYWSLDGFQRSAACQKLGIRLRAYILEANDPRGPELALHANFMRAAPSPAARHVTLLFAESEYVEDPVKSASGQTLGFAGLYARITNASKQSVLNHLNAAHALSGKMRGTDIFLEIQNTAFDTNGRIAELARHPAWTPDAIRRELSTYKQLPEDEKREYKFPTKRKAKSANKEGVKNLDALLREEDRALPQDAKDFLLMVMTWNLGADSVRRQFLQYLKHRFEGGEIGPLDVSEARTAH